MRIPATEACFLPLLLGLALCSAASASGEDWVFFAGTRPDFGQGSTLKAPYILNRLKPVPEAEATVRHYYDAESVGANFPGSGGIVRVWEKYVVETDTKTYEEAREEAVREEEARLKRKLTALDQAWIFPLAVTKATKEIRTLYEINCDSRDFIILEVDQYDKTGSRMTRETNFAEGLWYPIQPGTVLELLYRKICGQEGGRRLPVSPPFYEDHPQLDKLR